MKKLWVLCLLAFFPLMTAWGADFPSVSLKLTGNIKGMDYICLSSVGCVNIAAGVQGHLFPINTSELDRITLLDGTTLRIYPQAIPTSCKGAITESSKVVISGKLVKSKESYRIENLTCKILAAN